MSLTTNPTGKSPSLNGSGDISQPSRLQNVKDGLAGITTTITSVQWKAGGASLFYTVVIGPLSWIWSKITGLGSKILDKIYGPGRIPATIIPIERKGWLGSVYIENVSLESALENNDITPKKALDKGHCNQSYLTARGYDNVKFTYSNWRYADSEYEGTLRAALQGRYITIKEAIDQNFITESQAIEGGFLKAAEIATK